LAPPHAVKAELTLFVHHFAAMDLTNAPLFDILQNRLSYLTSRQQVIAQNVANSDTPGYTAMDLKPFTLPKKGPLGLAPVQTTLTSPMHLAPPSVKTGAGAKPVSSPDSETTLNGNSVVLEDEMMKMTQARMDFDAAISFYQQANQMITTAAKRPGA
jgi:flagellar basal-body rod protein FlgB